MKAVCFARRQGQTLEAGDTVHSEFRTPHGVQDGGALLKSAKSQVQVWTRERSQNAYCFPGQMRYLGRGARKRETGLTHSEPSVAPVVDGDLPGFLESGVAVEIKQTRSLPVTIERHPPSAPRVFRSS